MDINKKIIIYTDGGARGNPGPAGVGVCIFDENKNVIKESCQFIGHATNNQAEYRALILALENAKEIGAEYLDCYLDSELVVKQLNREYRVKDKDLAPLFVKVYNLTLGFKKVIFNHVRREMNKQADKLVNKAIDEGIGK
jgi:ribonuclease HI